MANNVVKSGHGRLPGYITGDGLPRPIYKDGKELSPDSSRVREEMRNLVEGCRCRGDRGFLPVQDAVFALLSLSKPDSPLGSIESEELSKKLTNGALRARRKGESLMLHLAPLLAGDASLESLRSMTSMFERHSFGTAFTFYRGVIDCVTLSLKEGAVAGFIDVKRKKEARDTIELMTKIVEERYVNPCNEFTKLLDGFGMMVDAVSAGIGVFDPAFVINWRNATLDARDMIGDARDLLLSMEVAFSYLNSILRRRPGVIFPMLEWLSENDIDRIDLCIAFIFSLNTGRSDAKRVTRRCSELPKVEIPRSVRADFFRVMHRIILQAILRSDFTRQDRYIAVTSSQEEDLVAIQVRDNGVRIADVEMESGAGGSGKLAIARRIVEKRDWRMDVSSEEELGTNVRLVIDTGSWDDADGQSGGTSDAQIVGGGNVYGFQDCAAGDAVACAEAATAFNPAVFFPVPGVMAL